MIGNDISGICYSMNPMATILNTHDVKRRPGSLKILNFAILDSISATDAQRINNLTRKIRSALPRDPASTLAVIPQGKNNCAPSAKKITYLFADAHSIRASRLPEYSRIIAS